MMRNFVGLDILVSRESLTESTILNSKNRLMEQLFFRHGETFTGMLTDLFFVMMEEDTTRGFEAMNVALKQRAEATSEASL